MNKSLPIHALILALVASLTYGKLVITKADREVRPPTIFAVLFLLSQ